MRIGIVIPAYNVARWLGQAIRSVLAQTAPNWVMTIVDDGSTDETARLAVGFADPRLRLIRQPNAGVSAARNRGLAATDAEAILFLDADDWLSPNALARLAAALETAPNAIAAVGPYARVMEAGDRVGRSSRPPSGDLLRSLLVRNLFANGGHLLIRRRALDAAGPFDPRLSYGEDWEFWTRLARLGPFAAVAGRPLLFVRVRHDGAYRAMATRPDAFAPCMRAIFRAPALTARFGAAEVARLWARAEAENHWIIGRELIRHGRVAEGRTYLRRSVAAAPGAKRLALFAAAMLPARVGPFHRYPPS